jgi:Fe-S oxidoreductase
LTTLESLIFAVLLLCGIGFFLKNVFRLFSNVCLGQWENRFDRLWSRLKDMFVFAFLQLRVVSEKFGINHLLLFWGFMVLLLVNTQFFISGVFPRFSFEFLGDIPYRILLLMADIMSLVVLACVVIAVFRRVFFRPPHIEASLDAFFILFLVASLMTAYFGMHACEFRMGEELPAAWMPVSAAFAKMAAGISLESAHRYARIFWWIHALVLLFFLNYLPYSKHLHILTAIPNCFFRSFSFVSTVPRLIFKKGNTFGISKVVQFTWKDLFDFLSCTECGRCQAACPAHNTGKPLNPRLVIREGKLNLLANGSVVRATRPADTLASAPPDALMKIPLINGREESVAVDAIWACTTCGACMVKCPVFIEHVPKLIGMRRHLVMEKAQFAEELIAFFENTEQRSNPWGIAPTDRAKWTQDLAVKTLADSPGAEYLLYVGCAGSFDSRNRQVVTALTTILNAAQLSWGILGTEEKCCGDSLRRLGNEYVFDRLARENIALFKKHGVKKIITFCPHCFSTLKNDYRQYGADYEVIHHSQFINSLLEQGRIKLGNGTNGKTVIHDSCYLGRYNNIYNEPRAIINAATGSAPLEMKRCGEESFCCGAGGGRMWMEELIGKRIYLERTQEALRTDPSTIAVACPYCMTMFEDGLKDEKAQDRVKVKDIAEIVAEAM